MKKKISLIVALWFFVFFSANVFGGSLRKEKLPLIKKRLEIIKEFPGLTYPEPRVSADEIIKLLLNVGIDIEKLWEEERNESEEFYQKELFEEFKKQCSCYKDEDFNTKPLMIIYDYNDKPAAFIYGAYYRGEDPKRKGLIDFIGGFYDNIEWLPYISKSSYFVKNRIGWEMSDLSNYYGRSDISRSDISKYIEKWITIKGFDERVFSFCLN
ncbi:hypothetical protein J7L48_02730, partial [bacterium]|nr:hypothetical protein [bacterium]